jgi:hypothetical protein
MPKLYDDVGRNGFNIYPMSCIRVGHDGSGIAVDENNPVPLFLQCLASLGPGIIKFAGLANHDRAGTNNEYLVYVSAFGHGSYFILIFSVDYSFSMNETEFGNLKRLRAQGIGLLFPFAP